MNKKISLGLAISLMAIAAALTFIISTSYSVSLYNNLISDVQERAEMYTKLEQIDTYVRSYYNGTIDEDELIEALAEAYIGVLGDATAEYYDENEYELYQEHVSGTHLGIGIYFEDVGGCPSVTDIIPNGPAETVGIAVGDSIIEINGYSVLEMGYDWAYSMLTAEAGTQLTLTVRSSGEDTSYTLSTVQMTVATVTSQRFDTYAYIKVTEFSEITYRQFIAAYLSQLSNSETTGIIIDLRNNSGVIFDPVFNLLNVLLPADSVPYISTSLDGTQSSGDLCDGTNTPAVPVVVLVNSRTSGPAELFAAALRDGLGATIVGSTTQGSAQLLEVYSLYDSTAISIPTATLSGPLTEFSGIGVKPDYEADLNSDLKLLDETTDGCIKKAIEVLSQSSTTVE
ncbi:MAG: S41 family peptidase [Oscillospiraceae bacterium]|nr:S41 family peptidase [Oscillospiraceae bacterium]